MINTFLPVQTKTVLPIPIHAVLSWLFSSGPMVGGRFTISNMASAMFLSLIKSFQECWPFRIWHKDVYYRIRLSSLFLPLTSKRAPNEVVKGDGWVYGWMDGSVCLNAVFLGDWRRAGCSHTCQRRGLIYWSRDLALLWMLNTNCLGSLFKYSRICGW